MRIVIDYRPALRARSGVGEYVHQTAHALALGYPDDALTLFTSSWKDRPGVGVASARPGLRVSDHRVPVSVLNFSWHRLAWPPIELFARRPFDVAFSPHPLLMPTRHAAQVVMIHDLDFLRYPERTVREIRRDYPTLAPPHARRASRVIVPSQYTADAVVEELGVPRRRVLMCPPGAPEWRDPIAGRAATGGYVLFVGTLEPRKNVGGLLEAYGKLLARRPTIPELVLAGRAGADAQPWLQAIARPPLAGHVRHLGYVDERERQRVYAGARVVVLPSYEEGFGMPALEAMSLGIPVVAADRGALPALVGDAGLLVTPHDVESIVAALDRVLTDDRLAELLIARGLERARPFTWQRTARALHQGFEEAIEEHAARCRVAWRYGRVPPCLPSRKIGRRPDGRRVLPALSCMTGPSSMDIPVVVFSEVDAPLLDAPESRAAVAEADECLARERIAVVFCSGKTRAELEAVRQDWGIFHPFICENGAGVFVPQGYFPFDVPYAREVAGYQAIEFGRPYADVVEILHRTADRLGIEVVGFSDMSVEDVATECELSLLRARLAKLREYGELFQIIDATSSVRGRLRKALHAAHLTCISHGPYHYVGSHVDPDPGTALLTSLYRRAYGRVVTARLESNKEAVEPSTAGKARLAGWIERVVETAQDARRHGGRVSRAPQDSGRSGAGCSPFVTKIGP